MKLENILRTVKKEAKGYMADTSAALVFYNLSLQQMNTLLED